MATVVNDRDALIMAAVPRFAAPTDRGFFVNPEQPIFKVTNGIASPSSFNFTPTLLNVAGAVSYVPSAGLAIAVSGNNFSLDYSNMTAATGTVTATLVFEGVTYTRTINVSKVVDGIAPKILDLAASSQVFKVDKAGVGSPGSIELIAYGQNLNGTPNFTIVAGTATLAIGSDNTRKQLTFPNTATDLVQVQVTQDGQTDTVTIVKVREGADGANAVTGFLTNEAQTVPANLDGSVISMTGATTGMKVFVGLTDDTANWTFTGTPASSANAITYTLSASSGVLTASALNAGVDAAYVDVTATRPGYPSVTKRFSLAKSKTGPMGQTGQDGQAGARGNVNLSVLTSVTAWSDAEANAAVLNMTGTAARSRDVVNLYRADRTWAQKRIYDGFNWSVLADAFDGSVLVKGTVLADAIDTRGLTVKDAAGNIIIGTNIPLNSAYAAAGTKNTDLPPAVSNLVTTNSLPTSMTSSTGAGSGLPAGTQPGQWEGPLLEPNSVWTPRRVGGGLYVHCFGTPAVGSSVDLYLNNDVSKAIPVIAGDRYEFGVALSTHRCRAYLVVAFYNASNGYITEISGTEVLSTSDGETYLTKPGNAFPRSVAIGIIPANAVRANMIVRMVNTGLSNTYAFASEYYAGVAGSTQTIGTPYTSFSANGLAQTAANAATAATTAQSLAQAATDNITAMTSDSILSRSEKTSFIPEYISIYNEFGTIATQADQLGVNRDVYGSRWNTLVNYVEAINPKYSNTSADSPIDGTYLKNIMVSYYDGRITLLNAISAAAATKAVWGNLANKPADSAILNSNVKVGVNLVPRLSDWPTSSRYTAYLATNYANSNSVNGQFVVFPVANVNYIGYESAPLSIPADTWYTVSFDAQCDNTRQLCIDLIGNGVDTNGIVVNLTSAWQHFSFTEIMPSSGVTNAQAMSAHLRMFATSSNTGNTAYIANVKVALGSVDSPWTDSVLTPQNAPERVMPNSINNTMFGGDLFSVDWNGGTDINGRGWLLQRGGVFYVNDIRARGTVSGGAYNQAYAWPARGAGGGYHLSASGILLGNPNDGGYFQVTSTGEMHMPGFDYAGTQLTIDNAILLRPKIGANMTASISPSQVVTQRGNNQQFTNVYAGTFTASAGNASGNLSYAWSVSTDNSQITANLNVTTGSQVVVYVTGKGFSGDEFDITVTCTVLDKDNGVSRPAQAFAIIQVP